MTEKARHRPENSENVREIDVALLWRRVQRVFYQHLTYHTGINKRQEACTYPKNQTVLIKQWLGGKLVQEGYYTVLIKQSFCIISAERVTAQLSSNNLCGKLGFIGLLHSLINHLESDTAQFSLNT